MLGWVLRLTEVWGYRENRSPGKRKECHMVPSVAWQKKKSRRRQRTSTQRDIEDKVLRLKEFVDVAVAGRVIRDGFA